MRAQKIKRDIDGELPVTMKCESCGAKVVGDATNAEHDNYNGCVIYSWVYWECDCGASGCEKEVER